MKMSRGGQRVGKRSEEEGHFAWRRKPTLSPCESLSQTSYLATLQDNSISRLSLSLELLQVLQKSSVGVVYISIFSGWFVSEKPSVLIATNTVVLSSRKSCFPELELSPTGELRLVPIPGSAQYCLCFHKSADCCNSRVKYSLLNTPNKSPNPVSAVESVTQQTNNIRLSLMQ